MFPTETVTVTTYTDDELSWNGLGERLAFPDEITDVPGVLVAPGNPQDVDGSIRPEGVKVAYTLYFPKTYTGSLRAATITVRGETFRVIGDPKAWLNPPSGRDRVVQVEAVNG